MKVLAIQTSPNHDGLTASCAIGALEGAGRAGADVEIIHLCDMSIVGCGQCGNGWGKCRSEGNCVMEDDFQTVREMIWEADALIFCTPVYYGDLSESAKMLLDRLRRCEAPLGEANHLRGKPVLGVAAAGGGGGGTVTCMMTLERTFSHMGFEVFDLLPVRRRTKDYILPMLVEAGAALATYSDPARQETS